MGRSRTGKQLLPDIPATAWLPEWSRSVWGVAAIFIAYACFHSALRLSASDNLPQDDVLAVLYSHTLELAYTQRQPPLYDWLLWAVHQLTGPVLIGFLLLKYALLTGAGVFLYLAGLRIYGSRAWATLAALSLLLLYQIGWNIHEGVTHSATMICAIAAAFWAFMRVVEEGRQADYVVLGIALGLGGLTKYGFAAFVLLTVLAAMLQPEMRAKILARGMIISLAIAAAILAPFAFWILFNDHDLALLYNQTLSEGRQGRWHSGLYGAFLTLRRSFHFLTPLVFVVPLVFTGALAAMSKGVREAVQPTRGVDWEKLLIQVALVALLLMLAVSLVTGVSNFRMRYMHPFYLLMPLWLIAMARRGMRADWQPKAFVAVSLVFAVIVVIARIGYLYVGEKPFCSKCRQMTPYATLAATLREAGFQSGTIVTGYRHTAGNMRRFFPEARVVTLREPRIVPPIRPNDRNGQVAIVWDLQTEAETVPRGAAEQVAALGGDLVESSPQSLVVPWTHLWRPTGYRNSRWNYVVIDLGGD